jgi:ABC-2 type transport system ATP-binding protein
MSDIITVEDLVEIYSDGTKAVDKISFNVKEGEFFGFLGPNGAGKSTTIKILTTLLRKTSGTVIVAGHDIDTDAPEIRKIIGVQSQETTVDGDLTGRENLTLQGHFQQMESSKIKKRINELLKLVELGSAADKRARNYSGGMKKRLDLATALIHEPKMLFLDEPTTGLDPQSRIAIWTYLERLNKEGTTIFLTTWISDVSMFNPISYTVNAIRVLMITGYDWGTILAAYGVIGLIAVVTLGATLYQFRKVVS